MDTINHFVMNIESERVNLFIQQHKKLSGGTLRLQHNIMQFLHKREQFRGEGAHPQVKGKHFQVTGNYPEVKGKHPRVEGVYLHVTGKRQKTQVWNQITSL